MLLHMGNQLADRAHKVWGVYKNIAAGRGLLQWIGLWPGAVAAIIAVGTWLSARIVHLARPEQFVLALFVFVLVLAAVVLFKIGRVAAERRVLGRIEFNYLPANPVDNGWTRASRMTQRSVSEPTSILMEACGLRYSKVSSRWIPGTRAGHASRSSNIHREM